MKKVAIVTGATGGLGMEFVLELLKEPVDEIWCVGRNADKLEQIKSRGGEKVLMLPLDLNDGDSFPALKEKLKEDKATISFLINCAGVGEKLCAYDAFSLEDISRLIYVNCTAVVSICTVCIPFMSPGARILNIASQSSFQPVPYLNLYASSKAFVRNYTRALNVELKKSGITATAVCPGWVDTDMLQKEINGIEVKFPGMTTSKAVAVKALSDAKKGKDSSVCTFYVKYMHFLAKVFPQKMVMKTWVSSIAKYLK